MASRVGEGARKAGRRLSCGASTLGGYAAGILHAQDGGGVPPPSMGAFGAECSSSSVRHGSQDHGCAAHDRTPSPHAPRRAAASRGGLSVTGTPGSRWAAACSTRRRRWRPTCRRRRCAPPPPSNPPVHLIPPPLRTAPRRILRSHAPRPSPLPPSSPSPVGSRSGTRGPAGSIDAMLRASTNHVGQPTTHL